MSVFEYIVGAILIVFAVVIVLVIMMQEGRQANLGVISGAAESFMDKGAAKTLEARLAKWTKVLAAAFFVLVFVGMLVTRFLSVDALNNSGEATPSTSVTETDGE